MELPSDATMKQKDVVSGKVILLGRKRTDRPATSQLEGAKLKEQLEHQAPLLDNIIGAEESLEAVSTTMRKRKAGPKAPNPLSARRKKDLPPTGRLSKKELAAQEAAKADRGKKRAREEERNEVDDEVEQEPRRATGSEADTSEEQKSATHPEQAEVTTSKAGGENAGAQKKRKRKRRNKDTEGGEDAGVAGDGSDNDD